MGGGSKTTTTNQNEQAATTPQTPNYALGPVQNYFAGIDNFQRSDPYAMVTAPNALQQSAFNNTSGLFQSGGMYGQAANAAQGVINTAPTVQKAQSQSALTNFDSYLNPATESLVDTTLADMDANAGQVRAQQMRDAAGGNAFGGSRFGIAQAATEGEFARARAAAEANLRSQAWNSAAGLSQSDAANRQQTSLFNAGQGNDMQNQQLMRQMQAAGLLSDIGTAYGNNYRADLGTQMDMGNSMYSLQDQYTKAPLTQLQQIGNLLNPGYIDAVSGKTVTGSTSGVSKEKTSGNLFSTLLNAASTVGSAAIMASDRRAKRDIVKLGADPDGLGAYRFNYIWDEPDAAPRFGVMADEVEALRPWALGPVVDGYATVDYGAL